MMGLENEGASAGGLPYGGPQNTLQVADDLPWIKGKHNVKVLVLPCKGPAVRD
jgi:hypothetical protein